MKASVRAHVARMVGFCRHETLAGGERVAERTEQRETAFDLSGLLCLVTSMQCSERCRRAAAISLLLGTGFNKGARLEQGPRQTETTFSILEFNALLKVGTKVSHGIFRLAVEMV